MLLDATDLILGRFATIVAKKALLGERIDIVNCEKALITGRRKFTIKETARKRQRGVPLKGPYFPRMPDRFVRRSIRGMLPYKNSRGREAFEAIMCYIGVPDKFREQKMETIDSANIKKVPNLKYVKVSELCRLMGSKSE